MLTQSAIVALKLNIVRHIGQQFGSGGIIWAEWNHTTWGVSELGAQIEFRPKVVGDFTSGFLVEIEAKGAFWCDVYREVGRFRFRWHYAGTSTY
jgi:hypothetical protein